MTTLKNATLPIIAGGLLMLPATLTSSTMKCEYGAPTPATATWDFSGEASNKFTEIEKLTDEIERDADKLVSFSNPSSLLTVQSHDRKLVEIRDNINEVSSRLCRLKLIDRVLEPWQQNVIDQLESEFYTMARNANRAVELVQENRSRESLVLNETYRASVNHIYQQASVISELVEDGLRYREAVDLVGRFQETDD